MALGAAAEAVRSANQIVQSAEYSGKFGFGIISVYTIRLLNRDSISRGSTLEAGRNGADMVEALAGMRTSTDCVLPDTDGGDDSGADGNGANEAASRLPAIATPAIIGLSPDAPPDGVPVVGARENDA